LIAVGGVDGVLSLSMTVQELRHDTLRRDRRRRQLVAQQFNDVRSAQQRVGLRVQHAFMELELQGQHHQGHVVMPRQQATGLIVRQAQRGFGILEATLNEIPCAGHRHDLRGLGVRRRVAQRPGGLPGMSLNGGKCDGAELSEACSP